MVIDFPIILLYFVEIYIHRIHVYKKMACVEPGGGGGALNFFFGGCVPHGFPKVGSRERIFLEK